ncbi:hypothetical protein G6F35_017500 [Rhizopus arrhizus]|nr:hypothetical protein G6F35_017500 [Rhizopus arrhizus]
MLDPAARRYAVLIGRPHSPCIQGDPLGGEVRMDAQSERHGRIALVGDAQGQAQPARVQPVALHAFERPGPSQHAGRLAQH